MAVDRIQHLLPDSDRERLPPLYSQEDLGLYAIARVKFFAPGSVWTWYASEGSLVDEEGMFDTTKPKVDYLMFGLVVGLETEFGYFSLSDLASSQGPLGLPIERDLDYKGDTLDAIYQLHQR